MMWPFHRKKKNDITPLFAGIVCPFCGGKDTRPLTGDSGIKTWRGQLNVVYRCLECRRQFYVDRVPDETAFDVDDVVEDEDALCEAEEELRRQMEEDDDRRFPRYLR